MAKYYRVHNQAGNPQRPPTQARKSSRLGQGIVMLAARCLQQRPFLFWLGVWVALALVAGMAVGELLNPGGRKQPTTKRPADTPAVVSPSPTATRSPESPLGVFGLIALSCAIASWLLARQFNRPTATQRLVKKAKPSNSKLVIRKSGTRRTSVPPSSNPHPSLPAVVTPKSQDSQGSEPTVTVVPAEEAHPLDWQEHSLADMLDLRKQRPLSSLM